MQCELIIGVSCCQVYAGKVPQCFLFVIKRCFYLGIFFANCVARKIPVLTTGFAWGPRWAFRKETRSTDLTDSDLGQIGAFTNPTSVTLASNPGPHHFDPSARPSWRGPGKTAGHLGNCKVDGSVRSQFSPFFTLTVARVPCACYEMSRAYITNLLLVLATTCRFLWASTKPSCFEHVEEKSSIDKQSDSIGNQTVKIGVRVRVSKSRFWCCFWSRSCVISVSTDSQKKLKKKSRSTKTSQTPQAWWKSSESAWGRSTEGVRETTCTNLFVDLPSSIMRSPCGYCDDGENTWRWGGRFFFISSLNLATHRQP